MLAAGSLALAAVGHAIATDNNIFGHVVFAFVVYVTLSIPTVASALALQACGGRVDWQLSWMSLRAVRKGAALTPASLKWPSVARIVALGGAWGFAKQFDPVSPITDAVEVMGVVAFAALVVGAIPVSGTACGDIIEAFSWKRYGNRGVAREAMGRTRSAVLVAGIGGALVLIAAGLLTGVLVAVGVIGVALRSRHMSALSAALEQRGRLRVRDAGIPVSEIVGSLVATGEGFDVVVGDTVEVAGVVDVDDILFEAALAHPEAVWLVGCESGQPLFVVGPDQLRQAALSGRTL